MNDSNDYEQTKRCTSKENDLSLYTQLVEELRHQHKVWIDNIRVMLTFNSLMLPASLALFALIARGEIGKSQHTTAYVLLVSLALIGSLVTLTILLIIRRVKAITLLRQGQVRRLEIILSDSISVVPFLEGYSIYGASINSDTQRRISCSYEPPKRLRLGKLNAFVGYTLIGGAFCIAYWLVVVFGIIEILKLQ